MPVQVQGPDGKTYQFPDGTDKNSAVAYFKKKGIGASPEIKPTGEIRSLTQRERFLDPGLYPVGAKGESLGKNLKNMAQQAGVGVFQFADAAVNPGRTVRALAGSVLPDPVIKLLNKSPHAENKQIPVGEPNPIASTYEGLATRPGEFIPNMAGQALAGAGAGEVADAALTGVGRVVPKIAGRTVEAITKTGPRETANLVKDVKSGNASEVAKATEKNVAQDASRKVDLKKHFDKTQEIKAANTSAEAPVARKAALNSGVEKMDPRVHAELEKTADRVNAEANQKYIDLQKVLKDEHAAPYQAKDAEGHIEGEPETITQHLYDVALEPLRGTETESSIVKSLGKRVQNGELELTYNDLQGYREEIGKKLRSGTLPSGEYAAYKALMPEIDNAMQEIANRHGLGKAQTDARNFYRQYAETFLDRDSSVRQAIDTGNSLKRKPGGVVNALQGRDAALEALARYNPELAKTLNTIRGYQAEAKSIPAKPKALKSLPKLEPKPDPVKPDLKTIDTEDIRGAKTEGLEQRANRIRSRGEWIATGAAGYRALSSILHGDIGAIPSDLFEGGIAVAGVEGISRLLENPKVVEFLTRPTARDIAEVPPDLRGDMGQISQIAAKKGIKVDPRLYVTAGVVAPKKRVAAALSQ